MNFRVVVNDVDLSDIALVEGLEISRRSDEAISTARVVIQQRLKPGDRFHARTILEQQEILIRDDTDLGFPRFGGYISEIQRTAQDNEKYTLDIRAQDFGVLAERKVSALVFTDTSDRDIAHALAAEAGYHSEDSTVDFTNILASFDARDLTVREAFERLAEITGCRWNVDPVKTLWYWKPGVRFAAINLSDTPDYVLSFPFQMSSFNREFSSAANKILLLGGASGGGELRVTREDTASIGTYGVIEAVKVDRQITSATVGELMLDAELSQRANPRLSGRAVIRVHEWTLLSLGQMIGIKSALYGINQNFLIHGQRLYTESRSAVMEDGQSKPAIVCEIDFGVRESDFVSMIRRLAREDPALPEAVIGPDTEIPAENITGVITSDHIGGVAAENIEGTLVADQIGSVHGETITGSIGGPGSTVDVYGQSITGAISGEDVSIAATKITGVIVGAQLTDQILDTLRLVGPKMGVVERIPSSSTLPALPHAEYPEGSVVMWNAIYGVSVYGTARYGSVLYKVSGTSWVKTSASATLTGLIQYDDIVSIQAQQITGLIIASQIGSVRAESITGIIQGDQIGTINASSITAVNATAITGEISAENITSLNAGDITMVTRWTETQIQSVNASSITAGTITATVRMTSPDIDVTSATEGYRLQINTTLGMKVTATTGTRSLTLTNSEIRIQGAPGDFTDLGTFGFTTFFPGGGEAGIRAVSTGASMLVQQNTTKVEATAAADGTAGLVVSGTSSYVSLPNTGSWVGCAHFRLVTNAGQVNVTGATGNSIAVYSYAGALIGKIPIFP